MTDDSNQVAIIGMAGRFPGAGDVAAFWDNLRNGRESIAVLSDDDLRESGVDPRLSGQPDYVRAKGVLADADQFDAGFFGYSPREAEVMDPQHRLLLECAWEALENAGCDPKTFQGRIGVFAGASMNSYLLFNVMANQAVLDATGSYQTLLASDKDFLATRVSYKLDLTGPSMTVQTACSTSLTAVHLACQSLLAGECDIAIAGGVSVSAPLREGYRYQPGGILSPDGHCRPFDADAGGTVAGNGVGAVVLRRLDAAQANGDTIDAVILGTALNNDGSLKAGYTAPSVDGQAEVIAEALAVADVDPATIGYVEAHGTGTALGDPIEVAALTRAYREHTEDLGFCALGSVKSNVGHLDAAAGVTALIKAVLALRHEAIPPTVHFNRPNPELTLEKTPFYVNTELLPWPRGCQRAQRSGDRGQAAPSDQDSGCQRAQRSGDRGQAALLDQDSSGRPGGGAPRRAGVSSFGIGGSNVHVVLQEAPSPPLASAAGASADAVHLLPISARTAPALVDGARRLADYLDRHPETDLRDVAFTLARRRRAFERRHAVVCRDRAEAVAALRRVRPEDAVEAGRGSVPVAFLFPGQGAQYVAMARDLYAHEPVFTAEVDRVAELFAGHLDVDLRELIFAGSAAGADAESAAADRLAQTEITQPALFLIEYALAALWAAWGVQPRAMAGHSVGEYVAACLAGVFSLADAVRLVAARGRLIQSMPTGAMLAVFLPEAETTGWLADGLSLAAVNSTALTVVSGEVAAVDELQRRLTAAGVGNRRLHTSHAFHSASMAAAVDPFVAEVRAVTLNPPRIPFLSNVTGTWITEEQATSAEYWGRHLREPVRFVDNIRELLVDPDLVLLEVGPGDTLGALVRQHASWTAGRTVAGSLRHPRDARDDRSHFLASVGALWCAGVGPDWAPVTGDQPGRLLRLPTYPFQRQRYWVEPERQTAGGPAGLSPATAPLAVGGPQWFHVPGWRRLPPAAGPGSTPTAGSTSGSEPALTTGPAPTAGTAPESGSPSAGAPDVTWVLLGADLPLGQRLAHRLADDGAQVVRVVASSGSANATGGERTWSVDPTSRDQHAELIGSLADLNARSIHLVHMWSLTAPATEAGAAGGDGSGIAADADAPTLDVDQLDRARRIGFDSLLALAQGLSDARPSGPVIIDILGTGLFSVTGEETVRPENAPLLGVGTVIGQEIADVTCRVLDVTGSRSVEPLRDLLVRPVTERTLALRGRHWWVRDVEPVELVAPVPDSTGADAGADARADAVAAVSAAAAGAGVASSRRLRDGGVYLITGGFGGVGLALAEHLAGAVRNPVLGLLGRTELPAEANWDGWLDNHDESDPTSARIRAVRRLRTLGARVVPLAADITDAAQTGRAVASLRAEHGPINGVIHAAGLPSRGLIAGKTRADADQVLAAKTHGTLVLDRVCAEDDLDFLLLCSSLTGLLGGPGQSDYAAANAFLDAYAQHRRDATGAPVVSVAWDTWRGVGMAAGLAAQLAGADPDGTAAATPDNAHPLLHRLVAATDQSRTYSTTLRTADSWVVDEHRIQGHGLVPGTTYLELVRAAVADQAAGRPIELRDVLFLLPVIVPDGQTRELFTTVETRDGELRFTVRSQTDVDGRTVWQEHATGTILFPDAGTVPDRDLAEVLAACQAVEVIDTEEELKRRLKLDLVEQGGVIRFSFGERWRCLRRIQAGADRLLVTLELAEEFHPDLAAGYALHPALLDVAGAAARIHARDVYYLPLTYRRLTYHAPLTGTVHCDVRLKESTDSSGETLTCDIELLDPSGRLLAQIVDFSIKRINDLEGLVEQIDRAAAPTTAGTDADAPVGVLASLGAGMSPADALAAFDRLLAAPVLPEQVIIAGRDVTALRRLAESITPALLAEEVAGITPTGATHPRPDLSTPYVAPRSEQEEAVAAIWREVLGLDRVGVDDDFFALGGHSLAAVQIGARLQSRFGMQLELKDFFDSPTVAHTVTALATAGDRASVDTPIRALRRDEPDDALSDLDDLTDLDDLSDEEVDARLAELLAAETKEHGES